MSDDELLVLYRKYKKRKFIIISILVIIAIIVLFIVGHHNNSQQSEMKSRENKKDKKPPILELTTTKTEIEVGNDFDYKSYIKFANDNVDGNIIDKVKYSKINVSKQGTSKVVYYVFDSSNNMTQQILKVRVVNTKSKRNNDNSHISENKEVIAQKPKEEAEKQPQKENNKNEQKTNNAEPIIKYFMFSDGYTMDNVVEECAKQLRSSGRSGECQPIQDETGIYLGMKLTLK